MIEHIRLKRFKGFKDSGPITIKPLTLLCGTNSSGKSTIIQSLLLLKQCRCFQSVITLQWHMQLQCIYAYIYCFPII